ncbi:MAG: thioredoxin domain-containing protein [Fluviicola sp.]|nr:thioredoxin domain-containing protein [Fluviicola sp.]
MKKTIGIFALLSLVMTLSFTKSRFTKQEGAGIAFKHISLEDAKKQAEKTGKLIFIDAYTSWCGPCKRMAATTFKDEKVAKYFNENFISLKIDVEKDADGPEIEKMYKIQAYPTLFFINGKGKLVKNIVGFQEADKLMSIAKSVN